jgi:hypothetical protein
LRCTQGETSPGVELGLKVTLKRMGDHVFDDPDRLRAASALASTFVGPAPKAAREQARATRAVARRR